MRTEVKTLVSVLVLEVELKLSNAFEGTLIFQVFRLRNSVETRIEKV